MNQIKGFSDLANKNDYGFEQSEPVDFYDSSFDKGTQMNNPDSPLSVSNLNVRSSSKVILDNCKADLKLIVDVIVDEGVKYDSLISVINDLIVVAALNKHKYQVKASEALGINRGTFRKDLKAAIDRSRITRLVREQGIE